VGAWLGAALVIVTGALFALSPLALAALTRYSHDPAATPVSA
jgi:hypothetical protein